MTAMTTPSISHGYKNNDDIVAPENSQRMYQWLVSKGVQNAALDTTSLTGTHMASGTYFLLYVITNDLTGW